MGIHRVGRTARAGRSGHTFTFVPRADMERFEEMLRGSADCWERISWFSLPNEARDESQSWYPEALQQLKVCLEKEENGDLPPSRPLRDADLYEIADDEDKDCDEDDDADDGKAEEVPPTKLSKSVTKKEPTKVK